MFKPEVKHLGLQLLADGASAREVGRRLGVHHSTVSRWQRGTEGLFASCPRCGDRARPVIMTPEDYTYLLGIYLGDGHISQLPRTQRFRISCDAAHPNVLAEIDAALRRCFLWSRVGRVPAHDGRMVVLHVYYAHLGCLFPQHAPGKKHEREIQLEAWQWRHIERAPWPFLRGLIQSDGCAFINRTGRYEYLSYHFANWSPGILDAFAATCDLVGVEYRRYAKSIRINRRPSVALLEEHVGLKG